MKKKPATRPVWPPTCFTTLTGADSIAPARTSPPVARLTGVISGLPLFIGLRYSFSRQRTRFIGVVSMVSLLGMAIGVASLITVLSVMNGFAGELRDRILFLVPHLEVNAGSGPVSDWQRLAGELEGRPGVVASAPYIDSKMLLASRQRVRGAVVTAVDPELERGVSAVAEHMQAGSFQALAGQRYGIVIGALQARALGVGVGDNLELTAPRLSVTPLGSYPRRKRFHVVGVFEVGTQLDASQAYISLEAGQRLLGMGSSVEGLRLRVTDIFAAPAIADQLTAHLGEQWRAVHWGESQGSLFGAIRMEKIMMTVLLLSVVAVAAFNIVSTLTMAVTEKRSDIAVLRTLGARAGAIMTIFVAQGLTLAVVGVGIGALLGIALSLNISEAVAMLEQLAGTKLFNPQVYFISDLPARLQWGDVMVVCGLALALSFLATLFPAWRASRIAPAEVLRNE